MTARVEGRMRRPVIKRTIDTAKQHRFTLKNHIPSYGHPHGTPTAHNENYRSIRNLL